MRGSRGKKGKEVARIFQNKLVQNLDNKDRGIKPKTSEDKMLVLFLILYCLLTCIKSKFYFLCFILLFVYMFF